MKTLLTLLFTLVLSTAYTQLPKITTSMSDVIDALGKGVPNEGWFQPNSERPQVVCIFRLTPVGVKHGLDRYFEMRSTYKLDECVDKTLLEKGVINADRELDYERLVSTIQAGSSEINKSCASASSRAVHVTLESIYNQTWYMMLTLQLESNK
jgi:hypothetical protein